MVLEDGKSGKKWRIKKLTNLRLASSYRRLGEGDRFRKSRLRKDIFKKMINCGDLLEFKRYGDGALKLSRAFFCRQRLCPMCGWRRSRKIFGQMNAIMEEIGDTYEFVFLTLTVRNVLWMFLKNQMDLLYKAFEKLRRRRRIKDAVRGWCRVFETTFNWQTKEFHPHFHVILAVDKSYCTGEDYITQKGFADLWKSCLGVDYTPIVDVRKFTESEKGRGREVAEVAKYTVKAGHIMADLREVRHLDPHVRDEMRRLTDEVTDMIVDCLDDALSGRRMIEFGGVLKAAHKRLRRGDDDDLVVAGADVTGGTGEYTIERYKWRWKDRNYFGVGPAHGPEEDEG